MSDAWLRRVVMLAMGLMVLHAVGAWTHDALGAAAAMVSVVLVGAVSLFSARMAGRGPGNHAWFVIPTTVFTLLPIAGRAWTLLTVQQSAWTRIVELTPFLAGFAAPMLLLLVAYVELSRRARRDIHAGAVNQAREPAWTRKTTI